MRILVGMSGGVDSALAALELKEQGHDVVCATMIACKNMDDDIKDAKEICRKLGVKLHIIDVTKEFDEFVLDEFKSEYTKGRTPNPCALCNPKIKFGVFLEKARTQGIEFDKFATGHYARVEFDEARGRFLLKTGTNPKKDQSYFLYNLTQEQLSEIVFPLGEFTKEQTRTLAKEKRLIVANKPDSQDFAGELNLPPNPGNIVGVGGEIEGKILGTHEGIFNFTVGQRKGIKIVHCEPLYVVDLRPETNEVVVGDIAQTQSRGLIAKNANWIVDVPTHFVCTCKIRSAQMPTPCAITIIDDNIEVTFDDTKGAQSSVATGQAVVFYDNDVVLGGAIIEKRIKQ